MRVLLLRPISPNERFGLGPFFRVEPLGLEYIAQALLGEGHQVRIADLRFGPGVSSLLAKVRPGLVGISCTHTVDVPATLAVAAEIKRRDRSIFTLVGGHAAGAYPAPLLDQNVDAVCLGDGEVTTRALAHALERGSERGQVPGLLLRQRDAPGPEAFASTGELDARPTLDEFPLPARQLIASLQKRYFCVHKTPLWAVETTRGCPYRCSFCSIWRHQGRAFRARGIDAVCTDLASVGKNVFIVDDLFWHPRGRSLELALELRRRRVRKDWILVQARLDTAARNPKLLEAWRPLASQFDIFFGFEAPRDEQLAALDKDMTLSSAEAGVGVARELDFGVTGNFVVDPDWGEHDFEAMWDMVDRLELNRCGYTVLTPLPGTPLFDAQQPRLMEHDWARYDMHHLLFEPKLGRRRFFELFVQSWKRNVLSRDHSTSKWLRWFRHLSLAQTIALARVLWHTQRMLRVEPYLNECFPLQIGADLDPTTRLHGGHPVRQP